MANGIYILPLSGDIGATGGVLTLTHGLGGIPDCVMVGLRDAGGAALWAYTVTTPNLTDIVITNNNANTIKVTVLAMRTPRVGRVIPPAGFEQLVTVVPAGQAFKNCGGITVTVGAGATTAYDWSALLATFPELATKITSFESLNKNVMIDATGSSSFQTTGIVRLVNLDPANAQIAPINFQRIHSVVL